jgi:hypothetical protein
MALGNLLKHRRQLLTLFLIVSLRAQHHCVACLQTLKHLYKAACKKAPEVNILSVF